jgi:predicted DNA-binding antitoxin AbrB/MazE fold protein
MGKDTEYLEKSDVPKPVGKILLKEGKQIRKSIREKLSFEPIRLKKKPAERHIKSLREDLHDFAMIWERQNEGSIHIAELKTRLYDST